MKGRVTPMDLHAFREPGKAYRPSPFWSWNDALDENELRRQVQELKKQGFGGYFMHSREGLKTSYLSAEWMERVKSTFDEGKKLGMETWLYDEDKWPSGAAGGIVTAEHNEFSAKYLLKIEVEVAEVKSYLADPDVVGVFKMFLKDGRPERYERIVELEEANEQRLPHVQWVAFKRMSQAPSAWYNNSTYADLLNPEAVQKFLSVTHELYASHLGAEFGEYLPGIFTDEPRFIGTETDEMPWTTDFIPYFSSLEGYDLADYLPSLFYNCGDYYAIRYAFFKAVTKRFIEAFSKPVYEFCEKNNLRYTGHYFEEDTMYRQATSIGAAMPHYEYMHIPGIDHLCRQLTIPTDTDDDDQAAQVPTPLTMKQVSSAAHQFGRKRVLSEIFGVSGHSMTFEDQKWLADYNFALGITFLCQHLVLYSMTGDRKRDYPPTISYHQPYWEHYHLLNDYFARASWVCSQGDFVADTLVLHPIGSLWATYEKAHRFAIGQYDRQLIDLTVHLLSCQVGFDFGDEMIMEKHASVSMEGDEAIFTIASGGKYKVVVIPPSLTWSANTVKLLKNFLKMGGKAVFVGEKPTHINGIERVGEWESIGRQPNVYSVNNSYSELKRLLSELLAREVTVEGLEGSGTKDIYVHARQDRHEYYYFFANTSKEADSSVRISLPVKGKLSQLDLLSGETTDVDATESPYGLEIHTVLHPCGSIVYCVDTAAEFVPGKPAALVTKSEISLSSGWSFERLHKNVLTLDYCRYSIDQNAWSEEVPVWKVRRNMRHDCGLGEYEGVQPWVIEQRGVKLAESRCLKLRFQFQYETAGRDIGVVVEQAHHWTLTVNGHSIDTITDQFYWDKQFGLIDISNHVKQGVNWIDLECEYRYGIEIEEIYIVGEFGVRQVAVKEYALTDESGNLVSGSWVDQGYPFYSGSIVYRSFIKLDKWDNRKYFLNLIDPRGTLFKVKVNQSRELVLISRPWEIDITHLCVQGENCIEIEVLGSLRNTFGPLHHKLFNPAWCGPESFSDERNWVDHYQLEDYGLIGGASVLVKFEG